MLIEGKIFPYKKRITKLFETASKILSEDFDNVNISLNFVNEEEIRRLNNQFRHIDKVTDVLSFPNLNKSESQKLKDVCKQDCFDGNMIFLGDIVICKQKAYGQAKEYGHSKNREVCFLALHGLLHLLGYDHIEKEDEKLMMSTAQQILKSNGVNR